MQMGETVTLYPAMPTATLSKELLREASMNLSAYIPGEEVVYFKGYDESVATDGIYTRLPNLATIDLYGAQLPIAFPEPDPSGNDGISFPLRNIILNSVTAVGNHVWGPLITFLARHASSGKPIDLLTISHCHVRLDVMESMKEAVREFRTQYLYYPCPSAACLQAYPSPRFRAPDGLYPCTYIHLPSSSITDVTR